MRPPLFLTAATLAAQAMALPAGDWNKGYGKGESRHEARTRADAVKAVFQTAWDGYYEWVLSVISWIDKKRLTDVTRYAFPNDELTPVNNSFSNSR
jgi:hypothetical protein